MSAWTRSAVLSAAVLAIACGRTPTAKQGAMSEQLRSDLDRAAAPTADLASAQFRSTQVVSTMELNGGGARSLLSPRRTPARQTAKPPAPRVQVISTAASVPSPTPTIAAVEPAAPAAAEPTAAPRPAPNPVVYPPETVGTGPSGVIIRGGSIGDDDHCERRPGIPIMINTRIPMGGRIPIGIGSATPMGRPQVVW